MSEDLVQTLSEQVETLSGHPVAAGWQPIATAPQDRTEMLGYRPDQGVFLFRYASMEEVVPTDEHGDPLEDYEDHEGWWHEQWGWMDGWDAPTHWMPKPLPPQAERQIEERSDTASPLAGHSPDTKITGAQ